ncbi:MAG: Archaeal ATPase, partial [Clostridia bacterium]|nr:Archaeal ATPase [Clostridia bacterium]
MGLLNRWLNGLARLSPVIGQFYRRDAKNREALAITLEDAIIPSLSDSAMVIQQIYELLIHDPSISERKKQELCRRYPCETCADEAAFMADVLIFGMIRPFQAHDIRKSNSAATTLSPIVRDYILGNEVPAPCAHFCGRDQELKELHEALIRYRVLFLEGVAGIGKSEIAKAYAREHKKEYTNSIYFMYSGDLRRDITDMYFADDLPSDTDEARFFRHDRFLRTLKEDTLLIIDNFDVRSIKERFLIFLQHYRCRIILTTRNHWPGQRSLHVDRIGDDEALFQLMVRFYPDAVKKRPFFLKLMMLLQYHTLIIELAARLFGSGMLTPEVAGALFCFHGTKIGSKDKIRIVKDGKARKDTFEDHIHALFGLYNLSEIQQDILRCMVLVPAVGIPMRLLGFWMGFKDLNDVNDLIELGLLKQLPGGRVALQNMLRPVCRAELGTSVSRCQMLLEPLRFTCQLHGVDVPDYKLIYEIVNCTMKYAQKDDMPYYLLLLEDTFQYLEKYQYKTGMQKI